MSFEAADDALEAIAELAHNAPSDLAIFAGGPDVSDRGLVFSITSVYQGTPDDRQIAWARVVADALHPASLCGAGHANYAPVDETPERVRAAFGPQRFARLAAVKGRYDPDNVFRFNLNIPPAATG